MKKVKLGEICEIITGSTPKSNNPNYWNGEYKWITPAEISDDDFIVFDTQRKITKLGIEKTGLKSFPKGTVLLSSRAPIGKVAISGCEMYCNQGFKNFICSNKINNEYLYYFLKSKKNYLNVLGRGATFKEISKSIVSNIDISLPTYDIQRKKVKVLKKIDKLIDTRKEQLIEFKYLVKSRFNEMFGDIFDNPQSKLEDHTELNPNKKELLNFNGNVSFLPMSNVSENGKINLSINRNIDDVRKGFTFFKDNDVIVAKITPCFENGKGAPVFGLLNGVGFGSTEFHVLRPKNTVNTVWLYHVTMLSKFRLEGERKMTGSGGQRRITKDFINNFKLNIPPLSLQNEFADFVAQVDKSQFACEIVIKLWRNSLKSSII
ncbi:restriction endonuclease subunit S [Streptococcus oralis]|uniref:restriction endonuclease subunit S n=1 Tax=Streptococcus oralis TaxID=1303 RepID=UPI0004591ED7|nr:restriction endonuclease subunit S [Streptococcus oralis subsp. oralis]